MLTKSMALVLLMGNLTFTQCPCLKPFDFTLFTQHGHHKRMDTICFTATFISVGKVSQSNALMQLQHAGLINKQRYKTAISFTLDNTDSTMYLPYKYINETLDDALWLNQNLKRRICITAVIYDRVKLVYGKPFFLIEKISFID